MPANNSLKKGSENRGPKVGKISPMVSVRFLRRRWARVLGLYPISSATRRINAFVPGLTSS